MGEKHSVISFENGKVESTSYQKKKCIWLTRQPNTKILQKSSGSPPTADENWTEASFNQAGGRGRFLVKLEKTGEKFYFNRLESPSVTCKRIKK